jgi:hypothetical protein
MSRYSTGGKGGQKGVDWVRHSIFCNVKIFMGLEAIHYVEQHGDLTDWYSQSIMRNHVDRINDQMPFVEPLFDKLHFGKSEFGKLLSGRGAFCLPPSIFNIHGKNELNRFLLPDFVAPFELMKMLQENESMTIILDHIFEVQEKRIIALIRGPCTYLRWRPDDPAHLYWGHTEDLEKRDHGNSTLPLYTAYAWPTIGIAIEVENSIHRLLREQEPLYFRGKGFYTMPYENAPEVIDAFIKNHHLWLCHGTIGFE